LPAAAGFSTRRAISRSMTPRRREASTPMRAQPRRRSQPSTSRPRPWVSRAMSAPEKSRRV
jgi:hypothetical protein